MYLQVVDFGSYVHSLLNARPSKHHFVDFVEYNLMYLLQGCLIEPLIREPQAQIQTIFCEDNKPYWRHGLLHKEYGINYKGNRHTQGERQKSVEVIKSLVQHILKSWGLSTLKLTASAPISNQFYGYEADDLVAGTIKEFGSRYKKIFLLTIDTDYLPFTADPRVIWCCTGNHAPRVRTDYEALQWCKNALQNTDTIAKRAWKWQSPAQLWEFKAYFGDASDNLRGDKKDKTIGKYLKYIDLFNPHPQYCCWKESYFKPSVLETMTNPATVTNAAIFGSEYYLGQQIAIQPYEYASTMVRPVA